jgi:hypothetical protein
MDTNINLSWIFEHLAIAGLGYLIIWNTYRIAKEIILKSYRRYGYQLYKGTITYRKAFVTLFIHLIIFPVIMGAIIAFSFVHDHILDTIIVATIFGIVPMIIGIKETLKELKDKAENDYKD